MIVPRRLRRPLIILLGIEIMLYTFGCATASKFLLFPSTDPVDWHGATPALVLFGQGQIEVFIARSPGCAGTDPQAVVLDFTGNAGRAEWTAAPDAQDWARHPVEVWAPNHPGFGRSSPPASLSMLAPAALAVYDAATRQFPGKPIYVHGTSLGATMALHVATNRPVAGLVIRTPPPLRSLILGRHGWWNLWLLAGPVASGVPSELNVLDSAAQVKAPALFLLMESDTVVPVKYQHRVVAAYAGPKRVVSMPGGDHNDRLDEATRKEFRAGIDWLWTTTSGR